MQSVEQYTEQVRTLTQQCIETFDRFMDESYDRVNGAIDSIYEQMYLKPAPEQKKKDQRTSTELVKLPDAPKVKIEVIINITPDETKSFRQKRNVCNNRRCKQQYRKSRRYAQEGQIKDCVACLQSFKNQDQKEKEQIKKIIHILKNIKDHEFNQKDYSSEPFEEMKKNLIKKLQGDKSMIELLTFLVMLTSIDDQFISCGSNSLHMLVMMKVDLRNQSFENIRIKNTSIIGGNFVRCNLNGSEFENVDISGVIFNGAQMFNYKWKNIKVHELNRLDGHSSCVRSVCFSPDGNTLASGSDDNSIRLQEIKKKYCQDYRFKEIQVKNTRYPFLKPLCNTSNIMVYPDFNVQRFKIVFYKKPLPFKTILGVALDQFKNQPILTLTLNVNLFQQTSCAQYSLLLFYFIVFSFLTILKFRHYQNSNQLAHLKIV
ncbi:unnamed protein product [Paramecium pentaurelia]|uniref:Uncharacterized protein n=1 Tax=Paramecium pentaurelia TaxID=43138 RepID=A0A8S1WL08_9CILI|nr:unnamed protein product [Paramecium pentaurelia]